MDGKQLTIPTILCLRKPPCSIISPHSADDAEPPHINPDEADRILNYASFEIATALVYPSHFRRVTTAPAHGRTSDTSSAYCGRVVEPPIRRALHITREEVLAYPCTPRTNPVSEQTISMPSTDSTFHIVLDVGVSTMPQDYCGWSQGTSPCNVGVSADTLVAHMRNHVRGASHRRVYCSWNGCGKLMRRDCLVRHIREIHLHSKRRSHE